MSSARRWVAVGFLLVGVLLALAFFVSVIWALGVGFQIYFWGLLGAWLLFAFVLPLVTGVLSPRELVDNVRARRRAAHHHEGEPLPIATEVWYANRAGLTKLSEPSKARD